MLNCAHDCRLFQRQIALIELGMIQSAEDLPAFAQSLYGFSISSSYFHNVNGSILAARKLPKSKPSYWRSWMRTVELRGPDDPVPTSEVLYYAPPFETGFDVVLLESAL
jgi:hypothetical protein